MSQFTIFTPNFLKSLENDCANPECHNVAQLAQFETNNADSSVSIKTVVIDKQLVRLEYDKDVGSITIERNGKKSFVFDHNPEFREYLGYFE